MKWIVSLIFCCCSIGVFFVVVDARQSSSPNEENAVVGKNSNNNAQHHQKEDGDRCGVWLALSTIPGSGIGMFAGKDFQKDDNLIGLGDHVIPVVDFQANQVDSDKWWLWDEYTWNPEILRAEHEGLYEVNVCSCGFGAASNSFLDFVNVDEGHPKRGLMDGTVLHRSKDPGAGAFTDYHSRSTTASQNIKAGEELFVSYGSNWFETREHMGPIPLYGDHDRAHRLYRSYQRIRKHLEHLDPKVLEELWDEFVLNSEFTDSSRVISALPPKDQYKAMERSDIISVKRKQMTRSLDWLEQNGVCADTMTIGVSTIPQAGHGAFATRKLRKGSVILPVPLIHITDKSSLRMHEIVQDNRGIHVFNKTKYSGYQLLLNYALGHPESSLLLSPYGPLFPLINHNQTRANVRLQWASPIKSQHKPELLAKNISYLETVKSASFAMELVALRDILPGEEILLDYGDDWEAAWQRHLRNWKPLDDTAEEYVSATMLNQDPGPIRTEFEQLENPYPSNVMLLFHPIFHIRKKWIEAMEKNMTLEDFAWDHSHAYEECEVLRYHKANERYWYTIAVAAKDNPHDTRLVKAIPQEALRFFDRPYTADWSLPNAFRHEIGIPDSIFPAAWRNLKISTTTTTKGNNSSEAHSDPIASEECCLENLESEL